MTNPLEPHEIDALLRPNPQRTMAADMLVLRDALGRMGSAVERFAAAVAEMQRIAEEMERLAAAERGAARAGRAEVEVSRPPGAPPRAD
jgi:hypothetical protein